MPASIEILLFAGRNVSADPVAFASIRGMPQCMAMGQATGTKAVNLLAGPREQGRSFGVLDGGRGLVEALLAELGLLVRIPELWLLALASTSLIAICFADLGGSMPAIGLVSFVGYLRDVLLPLHDGFLSRQYPGAVNFQICFTSIALCGYLGAALCLVFWRRSRPRRVAPMPTAAQSATEAP